MVALSTATIMMQSAGDSNQQLFSILQILRETTATAPFASGAFLARPRPVSRSRGRVRMISPSRRSVSHYLTIDFFDSAPGPGTLGQ